MARSKQLTPRKLNNENTNPFDSVSHTFKDLRAADDMEEKTSLPSGGAADLEKLFTDAPPRPRRSSVSVAIAEHPSIVELGIAVAGIYMTFMTWSFLQERLTTSPYGEVRARWKFGVVMLSIQSIASTIIGYLYILFKSRQHPTLKREAVFPNAAIARSYLFIALTQSLAAPMGLLALSHIDYVTYLLAKSCKLLPVMFLHVTLYRKSFPLYKYVVVGLVTAGVVVFTLQESKGGKKKGAENTSMWGMLLLSINLLLDGVTNTAQDDLRHKSGGLVSGSGMQVGMNFMSSLLMIGYLLVNPYSTELGDAWRFVQSHPEVAGDLAGFALSGACGQIFIFYTLSKFGSLTLVTTTVTRKMFSMVLSVVAFGHSLSMAQWGGIGLVFGGIGGEAYMGYQEKQAKSAKKEVKKV